MVLGVGWVERMLYGVASIESGFRIVGTELERMSSCSLLRYWAFLGKEGLILRGALDLKHAFCEG